MKLARTNETVDWIWLSAIRAINCVEVISLTFQGSTLPSKPTTQIPEGYSKERDGHYYKFHGDIQIWKDAQKTCESEGGNLATIFDSETNEIVAKLSTRTQFWVG